MLSKTLTNLLKKGIPFQWTVQTQDAFELLKFALVNAPVLAVPDYSKQFVIETDASDAGFGAVLMQEGHPISYLSKPLRDRNRALSTYEKECMALLLTVEKWRSYLVGQEFLIRIDHRSLLFLTEQKATTKLQQKALLKLMDLNFKIAYKQGATNSAADALSRNPDPTAVFPPPHPPGWTNCRRLISLTLKLSRCWWNSLCPLQMTRVLVYRMASSDFMVRSRLVLTLLHRTISCKPCMLMAWEATLASRPLIIELRHFSPGPR